MTTKEEAQKKAHILGAILRAKKAAGRTTRSGLIKAFALATIAASIAPAANAQSRGNSNQGKRYEYIQQPDGSFKMVEVTNNRQATTQQSYSRNTPDMSVQEIFNSLPSYTRALVQEKRYQILPEFQGGRTTGLNRPQDGVVYVCAVQDPINPDYLYLLPGAHGMYLSGSDHIVVLESKHYSKEEARNKMLRGIDEYAPDIRFIPDRRAAQDERYAEQRSRQRDIDMDHRDVRQDREETHVKIQKDTQYGKANGVMDGIDDVDRTINRGVRTVENGVNTVKRSVKTVKRIFGRD